MLESCRSNQKTQKIISDPIMVRRSLMRILFDIAEVSRLGDIFSDETRESHEYEVSDGDKARK